VAVQEHPYKLPTPGAISAQLFPSNERVTLTDVTPEIHNDVPGATKL